MLRTVTKPETNTGNRDREFAAHDKYFSVPPTYAVTRSDKLQDRWRTFARVASGPWGFDSRRENHPIHSSGILRGPRLHQPGRPQPEAHLWCDLALLRLHREKTTQRVLDIFREEQALLLGLPQNRFEVELLKAAFTPRFAIVNELLLSTRARTDVWSGAAVCAGCRLPRTERCPPPG